MSPGNKENPFVVSSVDHLNVEVQLLSSPDVILSTEREREKEWNESRNDKNMSQQ